MKVEEQEPEMPEPLREWRPGPNWAPKPQKGKGDEKEAEAQPVLKEVKAEPVEVIDLTIESDSEEEGGSEAGQVREPVVYEIDDDEEEGMAEDSHLNAVDEAGHSPSPERTPIHVPVPTTVEDVQAPPHSERGAQVSQSQEAAEILENQASASRSSSAADSIASSSNDRPAASDAPTVPNPLATNSSTDGPLSNVRTNVREAPLTANSPAARPTPCSNIRDFSAENPQQLSNMEESVPFPAPPTPATRPDHSASMQDSSAKESIKPSTMEEAVPGIAPHAAEPTSPPSLHQFRERLLDLVVFNAQRQNPDATFNSAHVESLVNEHCQDFVRKAKVVARQVGNRQRRLDAEEFRDMASAVVTIGTKRPLEESGEEEEEERPRKRTNRTEDSDATLVAVAAPKPRPESPKPRNETTEVAAPNTSSAIEEAVPAHTPERWVRAQADMEDYYDPNLPPPNLDEPQPSQTDNRSRSPPSELPVATVVPTNPDVLQTDPDPTYYETPSQPSPVPLSMISTPPLTPDATPIAPPPPTCGVPGLWFVKLGAPHSSVLDCSFIVPPEIAAAAARWARRQDTFDPDAFHVSVRVHCLPKALVEAVLQRMGPQASAEDITKVMASVPTEWPTPGTLIVDVNVGREGEQMWFADSMGEGSPPLDASPFIQPGANYLRVVQLADLSDRLFVVHAAPPSAAELEAARGKEERKSVLRKVNECRGISSQAFSSGTCFDVQVVARHAAVGISV